MQTADIAVIGGGIIGLSTAYALLSRLPNCTIVVLEKESEPAAHQTGRNSGVLHSGIYYTPGSLKARNCRVGKQVMERFCEEHGVPFERTGKVIVATRQEELPRLERILERGRLNGVSCRMIEKDELDTLEPHTAGIRALHVPETGIVDFKAVCMQLVSCVSAAGGTVTLGAEVRDIQAGDKQVLTRTTAGDFESRYLINCGGLYSDRLAEMGGLDPEMQIIPFRGEYYALRPEAHDLCRSLIYPVPDPAFPFLGVHFTRMLRGGVECGPNAVLAFAREGYGRTEVNLSEFREILRFPGFRKLAVQYWKTGLGEMWRSFSKRAFVRALQRLVPAIRSEDLTPAPPGIRAQALLPDGSLVDDFLIRETERIINVCNAPSPAATAGLQIGRLIADKLETRLRP